MGEGQCRRRSKSFGGACGDPCTGEGPGLDRALSLVCGRHIKLHITTQASQHLHTPTAAHAHVASMAADPTEDDQHVVTTGAAGNGTDAAQHVNHHDPEDDDDEEDEDDADEEPKLKYSRLTSSLGPVYRNGDATSSFLVAGDKMVWSCIELHQSHPKLRIVY